MQLSKIVLSLMAIGLLSGPAAAFQEFKKSEHEKLGKSIATFFEAMHEEEGITDAREKVAETLAKIQKRLKGADALKLIEDLQHSVYLAGERKGKKGKGKIAELESERGAATTDGPLTFFLRCPSKYSARNGPYPLVVVVPEVGEDPKQHLMEHWARPGIPDGAIFAAVGMPSNAEEWGEVLVGGGRTLGGVGAIMSVVGEVSSAYAVDLDRVFVCGRGDGVAAAMATASLFPHVFAGVAGRSGDIPEGVGIENFSNLPTYFTGAGANATAFETACKEAGTPNVTIQPDGTEETTWAWMEATERVAHPATVRLRPVDPIARSGYWVKMDGIEPGKSVLEASIDKETNTITVNGEHVTSVTLYFNDLLVDMDRPITVICNGTKHEDRIPRNLSFLLANTFRSGDSQRLYTGQRSYDLPERSTEGG